MIVVELYILEFVFFFCLYFYCEIFLWIMFVFCIVWYVYKIFICCKWKLEYFSNISVVVKVK